MTSVQAPLAWIPSANSFAARLALVRQRMGWGNVKEAAVACGVPPESWRSWERDGVLPRRIVEIAREISDRTGVDYVWLLTGDAPADDNGPRPDGPDGGQEVRHQGLEPRTRWFEGSGGFVPVVLPGGNRGGSVTPLIHVPHEVAA